MTILRLAIPSPLRREFDYLPPQNLSEAQAADLQPGIRVLAPFGGRQLTAYLVAVLADSSIESGKLKAVITILDAEPLVSTALIQLCQWAANYYQHPLGEVIPAAFSPSLRKGKPHKALGSAGWSLTSRGKGLPAGGLSRSPKQALALELLQAQNIVPSTVLASKGISTAVLQSMRKKALCISGPNMAI